MAVRRFGSSDPADHLEDLKFLSDPLLFGRHVVDLNASNNVAVRTYVWGLDLSERMDGAGGVGGFLWVTLHTASGPAAGTHFAAYDGSGNVVALSAATDGSPTACYEYGPFGEPIRLSGPAAANNPFRFSTKRTDNTTDLVLYEYGIYQANTGSWLSKDPIEQLGGPNLYGFVNNNPILFLDRLGLARVPCNTKALAACIGRCLDFAGVHFIGVKCEMERNPWTLGLYWRVYCDSITKCYLVESIPFGRMLICKYNCPARNPTNDPAKYALMVVPAVEGCPATMPDRD